jgi:hypothetical protein
MCVSDDLPKAVPIVLCQQSLAEFASPKHSGGARQSLEMHARRPLRSQQSQKQVSGLSIEGLELDPMPAPGKASDEAAEPRQLGVGNREAMSDPGRTEPLPLHQLVKSRRPIDLGTTSHEQVDNLSQNVILRGRPHIREDQIFRQDVDDPHSPSTLLRKPPKAKIDEVRDSAPAPRHTRAPNGVSSPLRRLESLRSSRNAHLASGT